MTENSLCAAGGQQWNSLADHIPPEGERKENHLQYCLQCCKHTCRWSSKEYGGSMKNFSVLQVMEYLDLSLKSVTKVTEKPMSPAVNSLCDQVGRSFISTTFSDFLQTQEDITALVAFRSQL